jgi:ubiquinone biosynthesis UbiH/UbiF/VisC/COQ6 family hydroxylase
MQLQTDICIIGDGAIGKTAALGFAQAGLKVSLLSPAVAQPTANVRNDDWDARVYAVNHVARTLLSALRVWDALDVTRVQAVDAMLVEGDGGEHAGKLGFDAYGAHTDALAWIVEDRNLNQALDTALKFSSNIQRVQGRAGHLQVDDRGAQVQLENGDALSAELVVGADGGSSWVRAQCDIGLDYRSYNQRAIVANFSCALPHRGAAYQWFSAEQGVIALLPLPGQRVSLVWSAPEKLAQTLLQESATALAARLAEFSQQPLGALTPLPPATLRSFPLVLMRPHAITAPRVALIGDAAHVIHPLAGHGMNLGFADVTALIASVAEREVHRDCGDARVLARYARSRKEANLMMQMTTDGLARLFASDFEPLRIARNIGLNLVNGLPVLKRRLIGHAMGKSG